MNWLMLRGEWDERTERSLREDDDMWIHLMRAIAPDAYQVQFLHGHNMHGVCAERGEPGVVWVRGGFDWQGVEVAKYPDAYKIYYGAGRRFCPPSYGFCDYDMCLVDTPAQKAKVEGVYPHMRVELLTKPAAAHFEVQRNWNDVEKDYHVCYVANGQQAEIKNIQWVYETIPVGLRCLHLGYLQDKYEPPVNVVPKRVRRKVMPYEYHRCVVGIVPYWAGVDSGPRCIPEMLASGVPVVVADTLSLNHDLYMVDNGTYCTGKVANKDYFWDTVRDLVQRNYKEPMNVEKWYRDHLSIECAAKHIRELVCP